ncbi:MAG: YlmC/YmxH family sporulation protein [Clostridium sp.]|uniref:YlmC/YmxH family sporulation protein n=1 Tax=Clostridium sp. DSM 8431 TaxID=1761781 RepID=UPI0008EB4AB8|nr:YlmC/YmxH family sporulation protein [Clostridium sp. DSM 8431]MCR4943558.1 YlmC/YmxH family sporulation protein [Clostridium sp.]SFU41699.1 sporulation protein, YlmC/YmxH family [Clostridium sp. DSM 8431]
MEENLSSINGMKTMEVIDINTGSKMGFIKDIKLDEDAMKVVSIILPGEAKGWFGKTEDIEIPWSNINKVGIDVILVDYGGEDNYKIYE